MKNKFKIGLFGTGLDTYWGQFDGLLDSLKSYQNEIKKGMEFESAVSIIDAGIVDNPAKAAEAASLFVKEEVELVFLYVATYCLSSTILPVAQRLKCPIIILNIQPVPSIDFDYINSLDDRGKMTGYWLEHCQACSVPEIANVFNRAGLRYEFVTGHLKDEEAWTQILNWIKAAYVHHKTRNSRMGILGHYYCGMLDVYTDITALSTVFGTHMELLEMCELNKYRKEAAETEIKNKIDEFNTKFEIVKECEDFELQRAAQTAVALDKLIEAHDLGAMAYYYEGTEGSEYENIVTSIIAGNTLLTSNNVPIAGECEIKNAQAMKIMSLLNAGGSFSEFYTIDFDNDIVMLGHDGPAHFAIAEGRVKLVPLPIISWKTR